MLEALRQALDPHALGERLGGYLPDLITAVVLAGAFWVVLLVVRRVLAAALRHGRVPAGASGLLQRFVRYTVLAVAALTIAGQLGVNVTSLVAGMGIAGLAISFAAQDTVANLISGITLAIDRPFEEGDWILLGDTHATVTETRLRSTVLTTFDNETIVVPNRSLAQERIVNYTLTPRIRARVSLLIAMRESVAQARAALLARLAGDERILAEPAPVVIVTQISTAGVHLELRFWTEDPMNKFPLQWEYAEKGRLALQEAGIQIPYPHVQLIVERGPEPPAPA